MKRGSVGNCTSVLVVEDNHDVRTVIEEALSAEGIPVKSAKNGKEALKALKLATEPTLIFMDLMMPVMSGWELLDEIKKDESFSQHKIVTISAINPSQTLQDPTPLDTDGTIRKPLSWEQIWNEVTKHCNMPSSTT